MCASLFLERLLIRSWAVEILVWKLAKWGVQGVSDLGCNMK